MTIEEYEKLIPAMREAQKQGAWNYDSYGNYVQMSEEGYLAWFGHHYDGIKPVEVTSGPCAEVYTVHNGIRYFIWMTKEEAETFAKMCEEYPKQPSIVEPVAKYVAAMDSAKEELDELIEELQGQ